MAKAHPSEADLRCKTCGDRRYRHEKQMTVSGCVLCNCQAFVPVRDLDASRPSSKDWVRLPQGNFPAEAVQHCRMRFEDIFTNHTYQGDAYRLIEGVAALRPSVTGRGQTIRIGGQAFAPTVPASRPEWERIVWVHKDDYDAEKFDTTVTQIVRSVQDRWNRRAGVKLNDAAMTDLVRTVLEEKDKL